MFNRQNANQLAQKIFHSNEDNIFAVEYHKDEAFLLAAFNLKNHFYGLAQITKAKTENLNSLAIEIENNQKDLITHSTFHWIPHSVRERFIKQFTSVTEVFKDPITGYFYSKLDILFGNPDEMNRKIEQRLIKYTNNGIPVEWEHFFNTEGGLKFLKSTMNSMEIEEFDRKIKNNLDNMAKIVKNSFATHENPVVLDLFGIDDISFAKSLPTEEDAFALLQEIESKGHNVVLEKMISS